MKTFAKVSFCGKFRDYQQAVLDNSANHISDGRIHIVAAPGSGKTILGLELVRRLNAPTLILSPSVTVRNQWGDRFSMYLPEGENIDDYVSFDLLKPELITSITYQALHAAYNRAVLIDEDDNGEPDASRDFSGFDLFGFIRSAGIKTICLDEAHHLRGEWQKALEAFIEKVSGEMKIIALTATPPYDSTPAEWNRYISVCGDIDEEIFVPQLVAQKTLCPHQDYVYFNFPTQEETAILRAHRIKAAQCVREITKSDLPGVILDSADTDTLASSAAADRQGAAAVLSLFNASPSLKSKNLQELKELVEIVPEFNLTQAEKAFSFFLGNDCFAEDKREILRGKLAADGLIEKNSVCVVSTEKIDKLLISSIGKLQSINSIVAAETDAMGEKLRMLILTDYIKKDMIKSIGSDEALSTMGGVPIFESIRRSVGKNAKIALLTGSLVILPSSAVVDVISAANERGVKCSSRPLEAEGYSEISFSGSNNIRVSVLTEAFGKGCFNILIGTKSLLGEGWDSPCINSLILASFVGSFMLSNQMRGRAIRTDKNVPDKASNIWHLITAEPEFTDYETKMKLYDEQNEEILGNDYRSCRRRFTCFLGPSYGCDVIESGIQRLDVIKPPYDKKGIERINSQMVSLAADRVGMVEKWKRTLGGSEKQEVLDVVSLRCDFLPNSFYSEKKIMAVLTACVTLVLAVIILIVSSKIIKVLLGISAFIFLMLFIKKLIPVITTGTPEKTVQRTGEAVHRVMKENAKSDSPKAKVCAEINQTDGELLIMLMKASVHDKREFSQALSELFSAIEDPRYLIIRSGNNHAFSFACPKIFDSKKELAEMFASELSKIFGTCSAQYTRSDSGKNLLARCQKKSYLNKKNIMATSKKIVRPM